MRRNLSAAALSVAILTLPALAFAGPPKPGKCSVASSGVAAEDQGSTGLGWGALAAAAFAVAAVRRRRS